MLITDDAPRANLVIAGPGEVVSLCAGPGGMDVGGQILGLPPMVGVELDEDACATGRAAGFERHRVDIRRLDPAAHVGVRGAVVTPPCPPFSRAGKRLGVHEMQTALDAITCLGAGCGCEWPELPHRCEDPRTALVVEAARWALTAPDLEWLVCEQVPDVEPLWEDVCAELAFAGWETFDVVRLDAAAFGVPSRRVRTFLYARRYDTTRVTVCTASRARGWRSGAWPRRSGGSRGCASGRARRGRRPAATRSAQTGRRGA